MKVACTVWTGGKGGDAIKTLPIGIVYGIAITAMSFFTDPTISTLTSGTPSQNVDLGGLSFPRRFGVRFNPDFVKKYHLMGMQAKWMSFKDQSFTEELGKDFYHEDLVTREGWARYYFKGKYEKDVAYIRLQILNPQTGMLIRTFYFEFRKSYQMSLDARYYITDPVLGDKIVKNGILTELRQFKTKDGRIVYKKAKSTFTQDKIRDVLNHQPGERPEKVETNVIVMDMVRYSEKPKMVFLVTPPHLIDFILVIWYNLFINFSRKVCRQWISLHKNLLKRLLLYMEAAMIILMLFM